MQFETKAWQYGVLGVVALAFAYAIIHLFRELRVEAKRNEEATRLIAKERAEWQVQAAKLDADYERRVRELAEQHIRLLADERKINREHEDELRREFAEILEKAEAEQTKTADKLIEMLQKFYDRLVGPSRGRY